MEMGPAMAMNLLFLISFSNVTVSLIVVKAPALLLLLLPEVTIVLLQRLKRNSEGEMRLFSFWQQWWQLGIVNATGICLSFLWFRFLGDSQKLLLVGSRFSAASFKSFLFIFPWPLIRHRFAFQNTSFLRKLGQTKQ